MNDPLDYKQMPKLAAHEHDFTIITHNWEYVQQSFTLRICLTCGMTHHLCWRLGDRDTAYWKPVEIWQED